MPRFDQWLAQARRLAVVPPEEWQLPVETSRGCSYGEKRHCVFCGLNGERMRFRRKSPSRVIEEFEAAMSQGVRTLHCVDNVLDRALFETVLPALADDNQRCRIFWEVRPDLSRRQDETLARSGVVWVQVGIESLNTRLLRRMGKGTTALHNVRFLKYAAQWGVGASWSLLFGFPGEDPADYHEIQELIPSLTHLQPPFQDHQRIRVDRFSPMFAAREGIEHVVPAPAYQDVFRLDPETVARLAYYFDFDYVDRRDPYDYVRGCAEEMERWRLGTAHAALVCFEAGSALHVVDTRPVAVERHAALRGLARDVCVAAEHGATLDEIAGRAHASRSSVESALEPLLARRFVTRLDGRYLTLAVPVDSWIPTGLPPVMARDAIVEEYCRRMVRLRDGFYADDARPPA
jgi:ribosomal peptide maturation radical SAM protein 1